jgi:hypothetical protein
VGVICEGGGEEIAKDKGEHFVREVRELGHAECSARELTDSML